MTDRLRINGWMVAEADLEHGYDERVRMTRSVPTAELVDQYRARRAEARAADDLTARFAAEDAADQLFDELIRREDAGDTEAGRFLDRTWEDETRCGCERSGHRLADTADW